MSTVAELREQIITYVATGRHPWNSADTVDLLIAAVLTEAADAMPAWGNSHALEFAQDWLRDRARNLPNLPVESNDG